MKTKRMIDKIEEFAADGEISLDERVATLNAISLRTFDLAMALLTSKIEPDNQIGGPK